MIEFFLVLVTVCFIWTLRCAQPQYVTCPIYLFTVSIYEKKKKIARLILRTEHLRNSPPLSFLNAKQLVIFGGIFLKFMLLGKKKSQRLSRALLGYMFKDFCSVYGV